MLSLSQSRMASAFGCALAAGVAITSFTSASIHAQPANRISRICIEEVKALCGPSLPDSSEEDQTARRLCLEEKREELSEVCTAEIGLAAPERREGANRDERDGPPTPQDREPRAQTRQQIRNPQSAQSYRPPLRPLRTVIYGANLRQQIDVYEPDGAVDEFPIVVFIHDEGSEEVTHKAIGAKAAHFTGNDYYYASVGYRALSNASAEEQAADIGAAIAALRGQAAAIGFNRDRIALIGHGAGARLAALVTTDPKFTGASFSAVKGVVLLDGATYDLNARAASDRFGNGSTIPGLPDGETASATAREDFERTFGTDPARRAVLSPITYVGGRDAPDWLALYVSQRSVSRIQSQALVKALSASGAEARAVGISDTDHEGMGRDLGDETGETGAQTTEAIDAFLAEIFG